MKALREHWRFLIGAVAVLCLSGAVIAVATDTPAEIRLRTTLGLEAPCLPTTEDSPGWREEPSLPAPRDENRAVVLDGKVYLAGGTEKLLEYGKPSDVPGVKEYVRAQSVDELMRFDPATRRFEQLAPMPERLNHVSMVTHDGRIYVVGGLGDVLFGADVRREMWEYDPAADRWRDMPAMPTARGAASAGVIGDTLYVAGGVGENGRVLGTVEAFDFTTGRWERRADMPTAREHAAYAVADDRLYVFGGRTPANDAITVVEAYEPEADRWRRAAPLPQRAGSFEAVVVDGYVVTVGGDSDIEGWVTGAVQRYEPARDAWLQLPPMRTKRHGLAAAYAADRIWAFGGSPCARFAASDIVESFDASRVAAGG
ncbi:MAG TPA: kelch repeat-containing protein [Solirubrobacteraceae bacterium]|nr:kelch repeat-containing protein [Solirubrobacteraceae bacterium]